MYNLQDIKARTNLAAVVQAHGAELRRRGREWWALCPFHAERTPSFHVLADGQHWRCFGCRKSGDVFDFVQEMRRVSFPEAVAVLADMAHVVPNPYVTVPGSAPILPGRDPDAWQKRLAGLQPIECSPAAAYLEHTRRVHTIFARICGVRFHPRWYGMAPAVVFPIRDGNGRLVAAEGRAIGEHFTFSDGRTARALSAGPKSAGLFMNPITFDGDVLLIVEGPIDALSILCAGFPFVAALCGAGNNPAWLPDASRGKRVLLALDNDGAGEENAEKLARVLAASGVRTDRLAPLEPGADFNDLLRRYGRERLGRELTAILSQSGGSHV